VACKKDIPYLKRKAQQKKKFFATHMHRKLYKRSWSKGWRLGKLEHSMLYEEFGALMYLVSGFGASRYLL